MQVPRKRTSIASDSEGFEKIEPTTPTIASQDQGEDADGSEDCWDVYQALQSDVIESTDSEHGLHSRSLLLQSPSPGPIPGPFATTGTGTVMYSDRCRVSFELEAHQSSEILSASPFSAHSTESYIAEERRRSGLNFVTKQVGNQEVLVFGGSSPLVGELKCEAVREGEGEGEGEGEASTTEEEQVEAELDANAVMARLGYNTSFTVQAEPLAKDVTSSARKCSILRQNPF
jgi:hypothetical protein